VKPKFTIRNSIWDVFIFQILTIILVIILLTIYGFDIYVLEIISLPLIISFLHFYIYRHNYVKILFFEDYVLVEFLIINKKIKFQYSKFVSCEPVYSRLEGYRLNIKVIATNGKVYSFSIYSPQRELFDFLKSKIT